MNSNRGQNVRGSHQSPVVLWRMYLLIGVIGIATIGVVGYGFYTGHRMATVYAPLVDAAMEIKLQATASHLWFEEVLSGDCHEEIKTVWEHLGQAEWYAQAMLEGGKSLV